MSSAAAPIEPHLLMLAYRSGIFPMADARDDAEVFWVEPRRRAILPLDGLIVSHSLARTLRRGKFRVTCNTAFRQVLHECAAPRPPRHDEDPDEAGGTWISHRIEDSYCRLHDMGLAHSIECWLPDGAGGESLAGGLYGVGFDRVFCGESMFSRASDASKVALCWLVAALRRMGAQLLDCQFMTDHLATLGAVEIDQQDYLVRLRDAQSLAVSGFGDGLVDPAALAVAEGDGLGDGFAALLADAAASSSSPGNFIAQSLTQTS